MTRARLTWLSGPVLRARPEGDFVVNESVRVGEQGLLGEVIRLGSDHIVVQVYEDTTGLRPGAVVEGSGQPLAVPVGPGLLGTIFDGLLRPLQEGGIFVRPGRRDHTPPRFRFEPRVTTGAPLAPGMPFAEVEPAGGGRRQHCLVPPHQSGTVARVAAAGDYTDREPVLVLARDGMAHEIAMSHPWPIRHPRPAAARLPGQRPMITGQRVLDALFPVARGGKAALPGGFGTGKTVLQQSLAKFCDADVIVYVGCGERGNEMAGVLAELPALEDPRTGRSIMERTVIIANTSNMPVAAREASIYTGVTVAEYLRDQGLHVALLADSTSRWAEALREISGRLGELPGEGGFPAYLSSRLAGFYERAAHVHTLGGSEGSLTIIGAVSPPAGDFSEPVTTHTKRYTRCFWALDRQRARARFFPALDPLGSYTEDAPDLAPWWQQHGDPQWPEHRRRFLTLLEDEKRLERMARIVGKEALPPAQQLILLCAEMVNEAFLRQSALSPVDRYASPSRQAAMQRLVARFIALAEGAVAAGVEVAAIRALPVLRVLRRMGEEIGEDRLQDFDTLAKTLETDFGTLRGPRGS